MLRQLTMVFLVLCSPFVSAESITGNIETYRLVCKEAAENPTTFKLFRSIPQYQDALELTNFGNDLFDYLLHHATDSTLAKWQAFQKLDSIGNPITSSYFDLGSFSATTLRYILIADQINQLFTLPENPTIVEIGGGFGGQCYILSCLLPFDSYSIYDLEEPGLLTRKVFNELSVQKTYCLTPDTPYPKDSIDLLISNYAFSECDKPAQLAYFEKLIKKAKRGYITYNETSDFYNIKSFSAQEFIALLEESGIKPLILEEPINTHPKNILITWDES